MAIGKGRDLGRRGAVPIDAPTALDDHELARIASAAPDRGEPRPIVILTGGDVHRTLGGSPLDVVPTPGSDDETLIVPIDIGIATIDTGSYPFAAHVVTGESFGPRWCAVMNAQFVDDLDLGPRSHPSDGLFDVTIGSLGLRQRRIARRRARSGTHLPHPDLTTSRLAAWGMEFDRPVRVRIDGIDRGRTRTISVECVPDAVEIVLAAPRRATSR